MREGKGERKLKPQFSCSLHPFDLPPPPPPSIWIPETHNSQAPHLQYTELKGSQHLPQNQKNDFHEKTKIFQSPKPEQKFGPWGHQELPKNSVSICSFITPKKCKKLLIRTKQIWCLFKLSLLFSMYFKVLKKPASKLSMSSGSEGNHQFPVRVRSKALTLACPFACRS